MRCRDASAASARSLALCSRKAACRADTSAMSLMTRTASRDWVSSGCELLTAGWWRGYGGGSVTRREQSRCAGLGVLGDEAKRSELRRGLICAAGRGVLTCSSWACGWDDDDEGWSCQPVFSGG